MNILSVDTSTSVATVSLLNENGILGEYTLNDKKQHSVLLMPMIERIISDNNLTINDVDGYVVSEGPGSFTGLRIGFATIKGLSLGGNKPLVAISNLDGLAFNVMPFNGIICPVMDALRGNVYTALYKNVDGKLKRLTDYLIVSLTELSEILKSYTDSVLFLGDATTKFKDELKELTENVVFSPAHLNYTRASSLGELGLNQLLKGESHHINDTNPLYLRKSQAEREYERKLGLD